MPQKIKAVGVIFQNQKGEILVLKRHKQDPEGEKWGLVGGKVDNGEQSLEAAVRETKEEINFAIEPERLEFLKSYDWPRNDLHIAFDVFRLLTHKDEVIIDLDRNENTEFSWLSPTDLFQKADLMEGLYPILEDNYPVK